jgi:hypothetical protein
MPTEASTSTAPTSPTRPSFIDWIGRDPESYLLITILAAVLGGIDPNGGFGKVVGLFMSLILLQTRRASRAEARAPTTSHSPRRPAFHRAPARQNYVVFARHEKVGPVCCFALYLKSGRHPLRAKREKVQDRRTDQKSRQPLLPADEAGLRICTEEVGGRCGVLQHSDRRSRATVWPALRSSGFDRMPLRR